MIMTPLVLRAYRDLSGMRRYWVDKAKLLNEYNQVCAVREAVVGRFYWAIDADERQEADECENRVFEIDRLLSEIRRKYNNFIISE